MNGSVIERWRRRRSERGIAVFLVVLVLTMVTAIGVFSMRSAGLVNLATGFNRQNIQATSIAEYAARGAATWLGANREIVESTDRVAGCAPALLAADPTAPCIPLKDTLLAEVFASSAPVAFSDGLPGLLSLPGQPTGIRAEFVTELVEPGQANAAAVVGASGGSVRELTFTTRAVVYPSSGGSAMCAAGAQGALSQQLLRAHVIVQQQ